MVFDRMDFSFFILMLIDNFTILRRNPYDDPRIDDEKENI